MKLLEFSCNSLTDVMVVMKTIVLLLLMHVADTKAVKWKDFGPWTCISEGWSLPATWHGKPHAEFIWEGRYYSTRGSHHTSTYMTIEDCKRKCVEYNMEKTLWAKEYPCRAIEWKKFEYREDWDYVIYKSICHLSFRVEHEKWDHRSETRDYSRCATWSESVGWNGWYFSLMNPEDIKGSGWTSNCTLKSVNYEGHDLYESCEKVDSYQACREKCQNDIKCGFWTWVVEDPWWADERLSGGCCLKDYEAASSIRDQPSNCQGVCLHSGPKNCMVYGQKSM